MGIFDWKHWIVILIVVILVFGTRKLKHLGTDVSESIKGFRKAMNDDRTPSSTEEPGILEVRAHKAEEPARQV
ncbi:twin-arginine translocase TatA/TatE family subunit [Pseudomonas lopnurensis]|uniref:twin-arginine translocase TatA/TatE family subunit n=1 Tax=Pseudomonas lopnurensis TaxID=1477517 RepID=UPI0028AB5865|nr:twin-arginine translocase TatA/TatE family subunit [Pseudomonas lopnurensis]